MTSAVAAPRTQRRVLRNLRRHPVGLTAFVILVLLYLAVIIGPIVYPLSPEATDALNVLAAPSAAHPLGTDELGRDIVSRLLSGGRISLSVGLLSMLVGLMLGLIVGGTAGYFRAALKGC